jgi:hypothetical protein
MSPRPLVVYCWQRCGTDAEVKALCDAPWHVQHYGLVAARSKAEVGRIVGEPPRRLFNLGETGNREDCQAALSAPGVVFIRSMSGGEHPILRLDEIGGP